MAEDYHSDAIEMRLIKEMVGKAFEVRPPETLVHLVKPERVFCGSVDEVSQLGVEFVSKPAGNSPVVGQSFLDVRPHSRVINYFHVARNRSTEAQNSSELSGRTRPESNAFRRRAASAMPSALASSWL